MLDHKRARDCLPASKRKVIELLLNDDPETLKRVLAVIESAPATPATVGAAEEPPGPIKLQLTPTVQRSYVRRGVFEHFRPEHAEKILPNLATVFHVSVDDAEEVLADATERRIANDGLRGEAIAFTSLIRQLERMIKYEKFRDCIDFPGEEKIKEDLRRASAILEVGTEVDLWFDNEGPPRRATISRPYGPMVVRSPDAGQYVDKGDRVEYRCGYATKNDKGEEVFLPAHMVAPEGESYGHLRLVR